MNGTFIVDFKMCGKSKQRQNQRADQFLFSQERAFHFSVVLSSKWP